MNTSFVKNAHGNIIGSLTSESSGNQSLLNRQGSYLGMYKANMNMTVNRYGHIIGQGNILMTLLAH